MALAFATLTFNLIPPLPDSSSYGLQLRFVATHSEGENLFGPWPCALDFAALRAQINSTEYGKLLTAQLLSDPKANMRCSSLLDSVNLTNTPLRLSFVLPVEDTDLCQVHWETLCHPATHVLLATQANVWCVRLPHSDNLRLVQLRPKGNLQAVLAAANPAGLDQFRLAEVDADGELARARTALRGWVLHTLPDEAGTQRVTMDNLLAALRAGADVLYLACHGRLVKTEPKLMLEDEQGQLAFVSGTELARRVGELNPLPRLIVLASCQSADTSAGDALAALGPRLAVEGVPAVLAMLGQVSMTTIKKFMPVFFEELTKDGQIDRALAVARSAVQNRPDWWMPVLLLRTNSGQLWASESTLPAPRPPDEVPNVMHWVGRTPELARYAEILHQQHWVALLGAPGVGKTALGAKLIQAQDRAKVFWHKFMPGESGERLIWKLAECLAWHGQPAVWATLQTYTKVGNPPPKEGLINQLLQLLREGHYLLGLDDCHYLADDPLWGQFAAPLLGLAAKGDIQVVFITQRHPKFITTTVAPLHGLTLADTQALFQAHGPALSPPQLQALHTKTAGNVQLLWLALDVLRMGPDPGQLISRLLASREIERFLIEHVDEHLTLVERQVMGALAALLGFSGSREVLSTMLSRISVPPVLNDLTRRALLQERLELGEQVYEQTELMREYFYSVLPLAERQALHQQAAKFYAPTRAKYRAALHHHRAGEVTQAIQIIKTNVWPILNAGQAPALCALLAELTEAQLAKPDWGTVHLAQGQTYAFLGETALGRASYQAVLQRSWAKTSEIPVRACLGLGELLQKEDAAIAQGFLEQGLALASDLGPTLNAALRLRLGEILRLQGKAQEAETHLRAGLQLAGPADNLRADALNRLGIIFGVRGDYEQAVPYLEQALALYEQLCNTWAMIGVWNNLSIVAKNKNQGQAAIIYLTKALAAAETLGNPDKQYTALLNLGILQTRYSSATEAEHTLLRALENARGRQSHHQSYALAALAILYLDQGQPERARPMLKEAEAHLRVSDARDPAPEIARQWAKVYLAEGQLAEAERYIQHSLALGKELNKFDEVGISLRVLASIQLAQGQRAAAQASLQASLQALKGVDAYEAERTQLALQDLSAQP